VGGVLSAAMATYFEYILFTSAIEFLKREAAI
jgi:hypothetical protein